MDSQFLYFFIDVILLPIWLLFFIFKKNIRKEMLVISIIAGILGIFAEIVYIQDWWNPATITGTAIGIEDFFFGFLIGGISSVIYTVISNEKLTKAKSIKSCWKQILFIILLGCFLFFGGYYFLDINTFIMTLISFGILTLIIWFFRRDLIKKSVISGILTLVVGIIVYVFLNIIFPNWIDETLYFQNIPKVMVLWIMSLEDFVWFFIIGCFLGPLYEYWTGQYKIKKRKKL